MIKVTQIAPDWKNGTKKDVEIYINEQNILKVAIRESYTMVTLTNNETIYIREKLYE